MIKIKSPIGYALAAAAVALSISPEARKVARQLAVKGTEFILDLSEQAKAVTSKMSTFVQDTQTKQPGQSDSNMPSLENKHSINNDLFEKK
jgi:hypothetical protein